MEQYASIRTRLDRETGLPVFMAGTSRHEAVRAGPSLFFESGKYAFQWGLSERWSHGPPALVDLSTCPLVDKLVAQQRSPLPSTCGLVYSSPESLRNRLVLKVCLDGLADHLRNIQLLMEGNPFDALHLVGP